MLLDLYTQLTTPCSPHLRNLGYLSETLDMRRRAGRNSAAWQPHLDATRSFVLSSAERCRSKGTVIILGSGLLLDLPLVELSSMFREVLLKDVICLPETRKELRKHPNVTFLEHDVTGLAADLYRNGLQGVGNLPEPMQTRPQDERDADLVVSLNILSQLWVIPRAYASRLRDIGPEQVDEWCGRITEAHYASLRALTSPICLIADHQFIKRDRNGTVISTGSTVGNLALPEPDASWTWNIAPLSKESPDLSKELTVGGWHFPPHSLTSL